MRNIDSTKSERWLHKTLYFSDILGKYITRITLLGGQSGGVNGNCLLLLIKFYSY